MFQRTKKILDSSAAFDVVAVAVDDDDAVDNPILFKLDVETAPRIELFEFGDCFEDPEGPCLRNNDFSLIIACLAIKKYIDFTMNHANQSNAKAQFRFQKIKIE